MLRFTPTAYAKYCFMRDAGKTEVSAFAISAESDPSLIVDLILIPQKCTYATTDFTDEGVAEFFDEMVGKGLHPQRFARIWLHTHPGNCPKPSGTDEETFARVFGVCDWAVMGILAQNGDSYYRLKANAGPGVIETGKFAIDYTAPFDGTDHEAWKAEYDANVEKVSYSWNWDSKGKGNNATRLLREEDGWKEYKPGHWRKEYDRPVNRNPDRSRYWEDEDETPTRKKKLSRKEKKRLRRKQMEDEKRMQTIRGFEGFEDTQDIDEMENWKPWANLTPEERAKILQDCENDAEDENWSPSAQMRSLAAIERQKFCKDSDDKFSDEDDLELSAAEEYAAAFAEYSDDDAPFVELDETEYSLVDIDEDTKPYEGV